MVAKQRIGFVLLYVALVTSCATLFLLAFIRYAAGHSPFTGSIPIAIVVIGSGVTVGPTGVAVGASVGTAPIGAGASAASCASTSVVGWAVGVLVGGDVGSATFVATAATAGTAV